MAGKKGSTQSAVTPRKMTAPPPPWLPAICAAFAGLEPQLGNHKAVVLPDGARYRWNPDSAAAFCEDQL
jgi:hypothetical protein